MIKAELSLDILNCALNAEKAIRLGADFLEHFGIHNPRNECEILLMDILNCGRFELYFNNRMLNTFEKNAYKRDLERRSLRVPLQYITGIAHFLDLELKVNEDVLIPRPETEVLVEAVSKELEGRKDLLIVDVGTGCANIAIGLTKMVGDCKIIGIDISEKTLETAEFNANNYGCKNIEFLKSDLFAGVSCDVLQKADAIVSNPPYISQGQYEDLPKDVHYEPPQALLGGADGLDFYKRIITDSSAHLKKGAIMAFEVGDNQAKKVLEIFAASGAFEYKIIKDRNNIERVVVAKKI